MYLFPVWWMQDIFVIAIFLYLSSFFKYTETIFETSKWQTEKFISLTKRFRYHFTIKL